MPPPVSYVDITPVPFSVVVTQAAFNVANVQWFRLVLAATESVAGFFSTIGGTFKPRYDLYESDGTTLIKTLNQSTNISWWYPLNAGTYYLKVTRFGGGASDFDFTFSCDTREIGNITIPANAVVINDDTGFFPAVVIKMDGTVLGYVRVPAGEVGAALPTGESLWQDRFGRLGDNNSLALFSKSGAYVLSTVEVFADFPVPATIVASSTKFFVLEPTTGEVFSVSATGTVTLVATLPITTATSIGVNAAGTILRYVDAYEYVNSFDPSDNIIHQWSLSSDSALADLYTVPDLATDVGGIAISPNFWPGEILTLRDGSVVTWARNEDAAHDILLHISSGGSLLHSYQYEHASRQINHIGVAPGGGSSSVNVWWYTPSDSTARIATLLLADGTDVGFDTNMFTQGLNMFPNTAQLVGPSTSCTMATLLMAPVLPLMDLSEPCCPCDCPEPETKPKSGLPKMLESHAGDILPPVDLAYWEQNCAGGGLVPTAADATDAESWVS